MTNATTNTDTTTLFVVTSDRFSPEPFVCTKEQFEDYCKEYGWESDYSALTPVAEYDGWDNLPHYND